MSDVGSAIRVSTNCTDQVFHVFETSVRVKTCCSSQPSGASVQCSHQLANAHSIAALARPHTCGRCTGPHQGGVPLLHLHASRRRGEHDVCLFRPIPRKSTQQGSKNCGCQRGRTIFRKTVKSLKCGIVCRGDRAQGFCLNGVSLYERCSGKLGPRNLALFEGESLARSIARRTTASARCITFFPCAQNDIFCCSSPTSP